MMPTREEIESMPANEMTDAAVWMYVFKGGTFTGKLPKFSSDISAAWDVVKEMSAQNYWFGCQVLSSRCQAWFEKNYFKEDAVATTYELPLAICRAALLAVQSASPTHDLP